MCLMIHRETDPVMLQQLVENNIYDIHIDVNTDIDLIIGDADCKWSKQADTHELYSTVSILLHELLHELGIYSLVDAGYRDSASFHQITIECTCFTFHRKRLTWGAISCASTPLTGNENNRHR